MHVNHCRICQREKRVGLMRLKSALRGSLDQRFASWLGAEMPVKVSGLRYKGASSRVSCVSFYPHAKICKVEPIHHWQHTCPPSPFTCFKTSQSVFEGGALVLFPLRACGNVYFSKGLRRSSEETKYKRTVTGLDSEWQPPKNRRA